MKIDMVEINDNHRRALTSALRMVQNTLREFVEIVVSASGPTDRRFSSQQAKELLKRISQAQQQVASLSTQFKIPAIEETDPAWTISVGVASLWNILEDCKSKRLRGYGEVADSTKPLLDKEIQKLIEVLQEIAAVARKT